MVSGMIDVEQVSNLLVFLNLTCVIVDTLTKSKARTFFQTRGVNFKGADLSACV